jgi:hypothetical protein
VGLRGKTAAQACALKSAMKQLQPFHELLALVYRHLDPEHYAEQVDHYRSLQQKGLDTAHGPWLGKALLWMLQVYMHKDGNDHEDGYCGVVNTGKYESALKEEYQKYGCALVFPQLGLAFR